MNPSRGEKNSPTLSLAKTLASSLLIAALISFLAFFYAFQQSKGFGEEVAFPEILAWVLSYGLFAALGLGCGLFGLLTVSKRPKTMGIVSILGIVYGSLTAVSGIPMGIFLGKIEFLISLLVIGACLVAIAILTFRSYREEFRVS